MDGEYEASEGDVMEEREEGDGEVVGGGWFLGLRIQWAGDFWV